MPSTEATPSVNRQPISAPVDMTKFPTGVELQYVPYDEELAKNGGCGVPRKMNLDSLSGKRFLIVSVPGAFTPACSEKHIPPYVAAAKELRQSLDAIIIISANDAFVLHAWAKDLGGYNQDLVFASDPNSAFSSSLGLATDLTARGMGVRTMRYAMLVDNNEVTYLGVEKQPGVTVSGLDAVKAKL